MSSTRASALELSSRFLAIKLSARGPPGGRTASTASTTACVPLPVTRFGIGRKTIRRLLSICDSRLNQPPMPERIPADHLARHRLRTEFDTTFFVEAGAGTGKTAAIVGRIAALVAAGRLVSPRLVAITFTEAAAAELRARVKERLEQASNDPDLNSEEAGRCQLAARQLDQASIDTIHAFARTLLSTFPLEARLPPNFDTMDEIEES